MDDLDLIHNLVAQAGGDVDKLTDLLLEHGIWEDEGDAALEASVWITGEGDVVGPTSSARG